MEKIRLLSGIEYARLGLAIPLYDEGPVNVNEKLAEREVARSVTSVTRIEEGENNNKGVLETDTTR